MTTVQIIVGVVIALAVIIGVVSVKYLGADNAVEKAAEEVIKVETGVDVNLTPPADKTQLPPAASK